MATHSGRAIVIRTGAVFFALGVLALALFIAGLVGSIRFDVTSLGLLVFVGVGFCGCGVWYFWASRRV